MLITVIVSLYTSRVVLNALGVEDYGIYNVVGGIVVLFGFLNVSMSGATSRFLTFELEINNKQRLKDFFSSALIIHTGIAVLVFIVAETIGLWFLCNKLVIPENRMVAAHWVYQLSVFATIFTIHQVPYNASIIAHERMDTYAYIEILNVVLKLGIVFILLVGMYDKLILYAFLVFIVSVLIALTYRIYSIQHFEECKFHWIWDTKILKQMITFSGWDLYGALGSRGYQQGSNFLLNIFFGSVLNAASGIATTVQGITMSFSQNILLAFRPQIIKQYAAQNMIEAEKLFIRSCKFSGMLLVLIIVPLSFELSTVMKLWLGTVPEYAVEICRILLYISLINIVQLNCNTIIHATGNIKYLSFQSGSLFLLAIPIAYLVLKTVHAPLYLYYIAIIMHVCILVFDLMIIKKLIPGINIFHFIKEGIAPILLFCLVGITLASFVTSFFERGLLRVLYTVLVTVIPLLLTGYFFFLSKEQRIILFLYAKKMIKKH